MSRAASKLTKEVLICAVSCRTATHRAFAQTSFKYQASGNSSFSHPPLVLQPLKKLFYYYFFSWFPQTNASFCQLTECCFAPNLTHKHIFFQTWVVWAHRSSWALWSFSSAGGFSPQQQVLLRSRHALPPALLLLSCQWSALLPPPIARRRLLSRSRVSTTLIEIHVQLNGFNARKTAATIPNMSIFIFFPL